MHSILHTYHYATIVRFMVISLVNIMYMYSKIYTGVARTFWLVLDVLRGSHSAPGSRQARAMTSLVRVQA